MNRRYSFEDALQLEPWGRIRKHPGHPPSDNTT